MKKIRNLFVLTILSFVVISCGGPQGEKAQTGDAMDAPETGIDYITYSISMFPSMPGPASKLFQ
ncbi:MAG: hypothetical protein K9G67_16205 [Bacteroidales bacterium]|nr:hypothetical protein [Bacteroidales bacterium]MCF8352558.1 hypothetical protein [Bacteroidales bacterium]MCF8377900.1 hypothetical protein [Bacteroidales bacterium]MCF8402274.1 hypothetical protein [Bacteroidales bacterium]